MTDLIRIGLAQINPTVGALEGNAALILDSIEDAKSRGCQLVVLPELAVTGYPPEDLLLSESFLARTEAQVDSLAAQVDGITALVGTVERRPEGVFNAMAIISDGRLQGHARKCRLPNYGVFDERRYFVAAEAGTVITLGDLIVGVSVCEDIWHAGDPTTSAVASGASLIVNASASPYHSGKGGEREAMLTNRARQHSVPIAYCALVGGQDELVFDGQSLVVDSDGTLIGRAAQFEADLLVCDVPVVPRPQPDDAPLASVATIASGSSESVSFHSLENRVAHALSPIGEIERALCLGLHDYVEKNGFGGVVLGVSGGIDSAVVLSLAVDALGAERTHGVVMPSPWSSSETQSDARRICENLGVSCLELEINDLMDGYSGALGAAPSGPGDSVAEENIQARIRGNLLMALSNRQGWLVVTTGNKSELAVGYSTLYGDAAGGFGLLKDVPKGTVYDLARLRNSRSDCPIPRSIIDRAPSAELRPGQLDEDSLPPYPILDEILRLYVEERAGRDRIVATVGDGAVVDRVLGLVDRAEYKRRQYPPGVKISPLAFGRDRRMPMTNGFRP